MVAWVKAVGLGAVGQSSGECRERSDRRTFGHCGGFSGYKIQLLQAVCVADYISTVHKLVTNTKERPIARFGRRRRCHRVHSEHPVT